MTRGNICRKKKRNETERKIKGKKIKKLYERKIGKKPRKRRKQQ